MDNESLTILAKLLRTQRTAALATLRQGEPLVTMVLFVPAADFSAFYIHVSRLAYHTQAILKDPRVSLMIAETDRGDRDPQMLARVSFRGEAIAMSGADDDHEAARASYLARYPGSRQTFMLGDFSLYRIQPKAIRFVAGFGRIFNPGLGDLARAHSILLE